MDTKELSDKAVETVRILYTTDKMSSGDIAFFGMMIQSLAMQLVSVQASNEINKYR